MAADTTILSTTTQSGGDRRRGPGEDVPTLTVVHHPSDPGLVGARRTLVRGETVLFGRTAEAGIAGVFLHHRVSRRHASLKLADGATATLQDLGSRNGTFLDGTRVESATVSAGQIVGIGGILVLFHLSPERFTPPDHPDMIGRSAGLARALRDVELVAPRDTSVMIVGETGVGKELVAQTLHQASGRQGPLVAVNCAGMQDAMINSELFGHTKGAFTGADAVRRGLVDSARHGTLFLDELSDASPRFQASLLRLLETGEYRPVGSDQVATAEVRFVGASQRSLREEIAEGTFREDLRARLSRWVIRVPPLRERQADIPLLAAHFAERYAGKPVRFSSALMLHLLLAQWPGNVRELAATVERLVVSAEGDTLELQHWVVDEVPLRSAHGEPAPDKVEARPNDAGTTVKQPGGPKPDRPDAEALARLLEEYQGKIRPLAKHLGVARRTVKRWLESAGIDREAYRTDA